MEPNRVITISRQYGSGGRQIGAMLAQRLAIPFYDRGMIELAAKQSGISDAFFEQPEEACPPPSLWDIPPGIPFGQTFSGRVYQAQCAALRAIAQRGPCVIVGRGAGQVLRDAASLLNVFVYADMETRKRRAQEEYGDPADKLEARIAAIDKKRAAYFLYYADVNGRQMENYHLCVDSGFTGIAGAVKLIADACFL